MIKINRQFAILSLIAALTGCGAGSTTNGTPDNLQPGTYSGIFNPGIYNPEVSAESFTAVITKQDDQLNVIFYESSIIVFAGKFYLTVQHSTCLASSPDYPLQTNGWSQTNGVANVYFAYCTTNNSNTSFSAQYYYTLANGNPYPISGGMSGNINMQLSTSTTN